VISSPPFGGADQLKVSFASPAVSVIDPTAAGIPPSENILPRSCP